MRLAGANIFRRRRSNSTAVKYLRRFSTSFSGEFIISPRDKQGLFPFAIPLTRNTSGITISLLRWTTGQSGMDMPVVEVHKYGVLPLAKNVDQYIHRLLVEEDASITKGRVRELFRASDDAWTKLYKEGDFTESQMQNLDTYLLRKML